MSKMFEEVTRIRTDWAKGDAERDAGLTVPEGLVRHLDIPYGEDPMQKLDVYYPEGTEKALPTIISIHGGGWVYGSKELYSHYCMDLAKRGFTVVNFNYRLAPEHKYPACIEDCVNVLHWVSENAKDYFINLNNIFTVGDSAGGQLNFQLLTLVSNPSFAVLFPFKAPEGFKVRACGLNCGCYFIPLSKFVTPQRMGALFEALMPEDYMTYVPQLKAHKYLTKDFPAAFVMTFQHDYLKMMAAPAHRKLKKAGAESILRIYGDRKDKQFGHVFHLRIRHPLAKEVNDAQCAFFREHMV